MQKLFAQVQNEFEKAKNVLVISHRKPDADTLGAAISLRILLSRQGKSVTLACVDKHCGSLRFLPFVDEFVDEFHLSEYDLIVIVDAACFTFPLALIGTEMA